MARDRVIWQAFQHEVAELFDANGQRAHEPPELGAHEQGNCLSHAWVTFHNNGYTVQLHSETLIRVVSQLPTDGVAARTFTFT